MFVMSDNSQNNKCVAYLHDCQIWLSFVRTVKLSQNDGHGIRYFLISCPEYSVTKYLKKVSPSLLPDAAHQRDDQWLQGQRYDGEMGQVAQ